MPGRKVPQPQRRGQLIAAAYRVAVRDGLDQLTARRVAAEAGASPGLVFFHFGSMDGLSAALLDQLLEAALDAAVTPAVAALPTALQRLRELVRIEIEGLPEQAGPSELFFAYWFVSRDSAYRDRITAALDRYTAVFVPVCADVLTELGSPAGATADGLAGVVVALVEGAAVQALRSDAPFRPQAYLAALDALLPTRVPAS